MSRPIELRCGDAMLRSFQPSLTHVVLEIRNHPTVREHMRDRNPIPREHHERWVKENLVDAHKLELLVVYQRDEPVGIGLLRDFRGSCAEIGVMVVEAEKRPAVCYFAAHMVAYYAFERLGLESVLSYVPLHNHRALTFNVHCGFEPTGRKDDVYHELVFTRASYHGNPTHRRFLEKHPIEVLELAPAGA